MEGASHRPPSLPFWRMGLQGPPVLLCPEDIPSCPVLVLFQPCLSSCPEGGGGRASRSWRPGQREGSGNRNGGGAAPTSQAAGLCNLLCGRRPPLQKEPAGGCLPQAPLPSPSPFSVLRQEVWASGWFHQCQGLRPFPLNSVGGQFLWFRVPVLIQFTHELCDFGQVAQPP